MKKRILVVDDDKEFRESLSDVLRIRGYSAIEAASGAHAINILSRESIDIALVDYRMPKMDGIETMAKIHEAVPALPVIIITAYGDIPIAVDAVKKGAYDFLPKPLSHKRLFDIMKRAAALRELKSDYEAISEKMASSGSVLLGLQGKSAVAREIAQRIHQIARTRVAVLLQGESGTEKGKLARLLHNLSERKGPFVEVDMRVSEQILGRELFGDESGQPQALKIAKDGTLFLNRIEDIGKHLQGKIVKMMETETNIRFVSSSNADLRQMLQDRQITEEFFYAIAEFIVPIPPLREHEGDIPLIILHFVEEACQEFGKSLVISDEAVALLRRYTWPDNMLEMRNIVRRAVLTADTMIRPDDIHFEKSAPLTSLSLKDNEKDLIIKALKYTKGNKTKAAELLGVSYQTLLSKIKQFEL